MSGKLQNINLQKSFLSLNKSWRRQYLTISDILSLKLTAELLHTSRLLFIKPFRTFSSCTLHQSPVIYLSPAVSILLIQILKGHHYDDVSCILILAASTSSNLILISTCYYAGVRETSTEFRVNWIQPLQTQSGRKLDC